MARKTFATPVEESLQEQFKKVCKEKGFNQNEAIEILMEGFINEDILIEKQVSYKVKSAK